MATGMRSGHRSMAVYADWDGLPAPLRLGWLRARRGAGREVFEFEFDSTALDDRACTGLMLDPRLGLFAGRQHPQQGSETFGVFADASPDRWGRLLMRRRLERAQRSGAAAAAVRLVESDYLLGVHDAFRIGALRFRLDDAGDFLDNQHDLAAPPFVQLRELEAASLALERDEDNTAAQGEPDRPLPARLRCVQAQAESGLQMSAARPNRSAAPSVPLYGTIDPRSACCCSTRFESSTDSIRHRRPTRAPWCQ